MLCSLDSHSRATPRWKQRTDRNRTAWVLRGCSRNRRQAALPSASPPCDFWPSLELTAEGSWPHSYRPSFVKHRCHKGKSLKRTCRGNSSRIAGAQINTSEQTVNLNTGVAAAVIWPFERAWYVWQQFSVNWQRGVVILSFIFNSLWR